jgi:hypothetical protein
VAGKSAAPPANVLFSLSVTVGGVEVVVVEMMVVGQSVRRPPAIQ